MDNIDDFGNVKIESTNDITGMCNFVYHSGRWEGYYCGKSCESERCHVHKATIFTMRDLGKDYILKNGLGEHYNEIKHWIINHPEYYSCKNCYTDDDYIMKFLNKMEILDKVI